MFSEEEFQVQCHQEIEEYISNSAYPQIESSIEVPIIKDCTFVIGEKPKLILGHAKTDVCLYIESKELSDHLVETDHFKLYQNGDKKIRVPLAIFEIKRGNTNGRISTDAIRSRTIIAREINEIFPSCSYYFVGDRASAVSPEKIQRAGKHYDDYFLCSELADSAWIRENVVEKAVEPLLNDLQRERILPVE